MYVSSYCCICVRMLSLQSYAEPCSRCKDCREPLPAAYASVPCGIRKRMLRQTVSAVVCGGLLECMHASPASRDSVCAYTVTSVCAYCLCLCSRSRYGRCCICVLILLDLCAHTVAVSAVVPLHTVSRHTCHICVRILSLSLQSYQILSLLYMCAYTLRSVCAHCLSLCSRTRFRRSRTIRCWPICSA